MNIKTLIYFGYWLAAIFIAKNCRNQALVLMYHAVEENPVSPNISPKEFERQMQYLSQNKEVVPLKTVVEAQKNNGSLSIQHIAVTFDDGYQDLLLIVLPIIEKYQIPITVFVPSDLTAQVDPNGRKRLNSDELRQLVASPLVSIEAHGKTHKRMTTLAPAELQEEMVKPLSELQLYAAVKPRYIAYPYGARNAEVETAASKVYEAGFGITDGVVGSSSSLFTLHRVHIDHTMPFLLFKLRLSKAVEVARKVRIFRLAKAG